MIQSVNFLSIKEVRHSDIRYIRMLALFVIFTFQQGSLATFSHTYKTAGNRTKNLLLFNTHFHISFDLAVNSAAHSFTKKNKQKNKAF